MSRRTMHALFALTALAVAPAARAYSLNVEGLAGWQDLRLSGTSVGNAISGREGTAILGGDALLDLGGLGLGVAVDRIVSGTVEPWAGSIVAGFLLDLLPSVRLNLLGEIGRRGQSFSNIFDSGGATFVGVRPGFNVRLFPTPLRIGATGIVRWPTSGGSFGSPDYGFVGTVGFELP